MYGRAPTALSAQSIVRFSVGDRQVLALIFTTLRSKMNIPLQVRRGAILRAAVGLTGVLMLAACASTPPAPTANLQAAQQAIASAERAEAGQYAAGELGSARSRLASADAAVTEKKMIVAARFADESRAEAELASAKTAASKANAVNAEMKNSTATLMQEMQRSSGDKP
jgi:hypothetical protein